MFGLERTYLGLVLYPLQKLFRSPSPSSEEFLSPSCNLLDFSSSPTLSNPDGLKVALYPHAEKQRVNRPSADVYFEPVPAFHDDLVPLPSRHFEYAQYVQAMLIL